MTTRFSMTRLFQVLSPPPRLTLVAAIFAGAMCASPGSAQSGSARFPSEGIAAAYPGDAGIERDPRVVFVESFEQASLESLWARWESVRDGSSQSFSKDVPPGSSGKQSLVMERERGSGSHLYRRISNKQGGWGYERLFARYYVKFDRESGELHHFGTCLGGHFPPLSYPSVRAGQPPDGAKSFWSGIEPFGASWTWDFYTYWSEMRGSPPRGQTWGNSFVRDPGLNVARGEWICIEQMIAMNEPGDTNGEQALWINGKLISHLGKGFPNGVWVYDKFTPGKGGQSVRWNREKGGPERSLVPEAGAPFEGFRWRTVPELNVNYLWLYIYTEKPAGHRIKVWFDHVVVATDYIGPMHPSR
jgi:hypothetical protein